MVLEELANGKTVEVFTLIPLPHNWQELELDIAGSIEVALIRKLRPPWNKQERGDEE